MSEVMRQKTKWLKKVVDLVVGRKGIHIDTSQRQVTGQEAWYVAVTRARDNLTVFTDSREKLLKVIKQVLSKASELEAAEKSQDKGRGMTIER